MRKCAIDGCETITDGNRTYCARHYQQLRIHGVVSTAPSYKDPNVIEVKDGYAEIVLRRKTGEDIARAIIDIESVPLVVGYKWHLNSNGYCASGWKNGNVYLHRVIVPGVDRVDHINEDKLDNRSSNLRKCTHAQNLANSGAKVNSKTGVKGVHLHKGGPRFNVQIKKDGKVYCLGQFDTLEEAKTAYDKKSDELWGEYSKSYRVSHGEVAEARKNGRGA